MEKIRAWSRLPDLCLLDVEDQLSSLEVTSTESLQASDVGCFESVKGHHTPPSHRIAQLDTHHPIVTLCFESASFKMGALLSLPLLAIPSAGTVSHHFSVNTCFPPLTHIS